VANLLLLADKTMNSEHSKKVVKINLLYMALQWY